MEVIGKLLFVVLLSAGTAYSVIHFVGDDFLSAGLDRNLLEENEPTYDEMDFTEYRDKLRSEYYEYLSDVEMDPDEKIEAEKKQIWDDTVRKETK